MLPRKGVTIIHIEDPFLLRVNLNRAIKGQNDKRLKIAFLEALGIAAVSLLASSTRFAWWVGDFV